MQEVRTLIEEIEAKIEETKEMEEGDQQAVRKAQATASATAATKIPPPLKSGKGIINNHQ